jgi:hypothetical protein
LNVPVPFVPQCGHTSPTTASMSAGSDTPSVRHK